VCGPPVSGGEFVSHVTVADWDSVVGSPGSAAEAGVVDISYEVKAGQWCWNLGQLFGVSP